MGKPTKVDDLANSTSTVALVAAMPDVDALYQARVDDLTAASHVVSDCEARVADAQAAHRAALEKAGVYAREMAAPGAVHDPAERRSHALSVATLAVEAAVEQETLDEAKRLAAKAGREANEAFQAVLDRDAKRLLRPEGLATIAVQDKIDELVVFIEAAQAAHHARLEADAAVVELRDRLQGREPSKMYVHDFDGELRRFLTGLPMKHQMILHTEWPTHVDLRKLGEDYISRADA